MEIIAVEFQNICGYLVLNNDVYFTVEVKMGTVAMPGSRVLASQLTAQRARVRVWICADSSSLDPEESMYPVSMVYRTSGETEDTSLRRIYQAQQIGPYKAMQSELFLTVQSDGESEEMFEVRADDVKIHDSTPMTSSISRPNGMIKIAAEDMSVVSNLSRNLPNHDLSTSERQCRHLAPGQARAHTCASEQQVDDMRECSIARHRGQLQ
ncbi:hypothetical protein J6590_009775 [Homalodisca vitripennis]|nr:hypothetical protein J6590_009775 [Homalodisca vitripennis]